jgi:hypothetical protein
MHASRNRSWRRVVREQFYAVIATALVVAGCMSSADQPTRTVADVLRAHTAELMKIPGVVGTGEGEVRGEPAVLVLVSQKTSEVGRRVPRRLEGYPVVVRVVGGDVRALDKRSPRPRR